MRFGDHFWRFSRIWAPIGVPSGVLREHFWVTFGVFFLGRFFVDFGFVFGGGRRQGRGLSKSSDSADSPH